MSSVPACTGYVPSTGWRKKNKCKVCGQPLSNHNASAPITITKTIQAPVSIPMQTQPLPSAPIDTRFLPASTLARSATSLSPGTVRRDSTKEKKDDKRQVTVEKPSNAKKSLKASDLVGLPHFRPESTRIRSGSSATSVASEHSSSSVTPEGSVIDGHSSISKATSPHISTTSTSNISAVSNTGPFGASLTLTSNTLGSSPSLQSPSSSEYSPAPLPSQSKTSSTIEVPKSPAKRSSLNPKPEEKKGIDRKKKDKDDDDDDMKTSSGAMESREQVGDYILVDKLGRGAYGVVYKALHLFEGNTVAIKQLNLKGANRNVVEGLQSEIELLQSLDHKNITRYIGHIRKGKELSIVMEYVENGSLATMVKKYGRFPEPLCKAYIRKVLEGLIYLHEQGVIHRDIKPDNILITKDGGVKLADFGVSVKLNSLKGDGEGEDGTPAGTPYYMAPEVIEFRGAVAQSDVWSLGCTIIELLKGEPPYFSHDPFSAMYKMVEDEHPPLPSGISAPLNNFLMSCFHKDVNMRTSAKILLKHNWLDVKKAGETNIAKDVKVLENYNEELDRETHTKKGKKQEEQSKMNEVLTLTAAMKEKMREKRTPPVESKNNTNKTLTATKPKTTVTVQPKALAKPVEDEEEDWDSEFGGGEAPVKLTLGLSNLASPPPGQLDSFGFGDLGGISLAKLGGGGSTTNLDSLDFGALPSLSKLQLKNVQEFSDDLDWEAEDEPASIMSQATSKAKGNELAAEDYKVEAMKRYKEDVDDDDFGGDFGDIAKLKMGNLGGKLEKLKKGGEDSLIEELELEEETIEDEEAQEREKEQEELIRMIKEHVSVLKPEAPEKKVEQACGDLLDIFSKNKEIKRKLITNHGLLPMISMLDAESVIIQKAVLQVITKIIDDKDILVNICVMGVIPAIIHLCDPEKPVLTRLYAAYFAQCAIQTPETLQMFVACGGLSMLSDFLDGDYAEDRDIVMISLDCISTILKSNSQSMTPKNEYLHLFMNFNLLRPLTQTIICMVEDDSLPKEDGEPSYIEKAVGILKAFSMGDTDVKMGMCSTQVLPRLLDAMNKMSKHSKELPLVLTVIRNISGDRLALSKLSLFVESLCNIGMYFVKRNDFAKDIMHPVTLILYYVCRLYNKPHQESAVKAGLIPFLRFVVDRNKPLKEFSVPLLCELAKTSNMTRAALFDSKGVSFFLELLQDRSTKAFDPEALEALATCLELEPTKTEPILLEAQNIKTFISVFEGALDHQLPNLLDSVLKILNCSNSIAALLGNDSSDDSFTAVMRKKLDHPTPHARVSILKALNVMCNRCELQGSFLKVNKLLKVVRFMAKNDTSALVRQMAAQLLKEGTKE